MSVMLDPKLVFVLNLIGFNWPQADEDKLRESARHWREYASQLEHVIADTNRTLTQVRADHSGESIDALEQHWRQFGVHLTQAHEAAGVVAEVLDGFALAVETLKFAVIAQLVILAGELAATTGAAILTFGVAEAAAPEEIAITQIAMRWLTREGIQKAERLVAEKIAKTVTEHFLSIKNGLKALQASRTALVDFGKAVVKGGEKDLKLAAAGAREDGALARLPPRKFGSGRPPHTARVTVIRDGKTIVDKPVTSGGMTPEEAALGFPKSTLATHTEARAMRNYPLKPGDQMVIRGQYSPCPTCRGAMNSAAKTHGATITYEWPGGTWKAGGAR
jgi:nucleic acid/nucleotide deaminase of polymorphic system toxin